MCETMETSVDIPAAAGADMRDCTSISIRIKSGLENLDPN